MSRRAGWLFGGLLPSALVSCSLTGVADFELGECTSDQHCREVFNPDLGVDVECATYACVPEGSHKYCVRIEEEICDYEDNDCDGVIDEAEDGMAVLQATSERLASSVPGVTGASWVNSSEFGDRIYVVDPDSTDSVVDLSADSRQDIGVWRAKSADTDDDLTTLVAGCYTATGGTSPACDAADLAVAVAGEHAFFAQVGAQGCKSGEMRVGVIDRSEPTQLIDRGLGERDPTYRGVATCGSVCTDSGAPACTEEKAKADPDTATLIETCGASRPALAAAGTQALAVFLGQGLDSDRCAGHEVPVFGLGLHQDSGENNGTFIWSNPTNDGEPEVLGSTPGGAAPAVGALGDHGFLVAFPAQESRLRLLFVPQQPNPPPNNGLECTAAGGDRSCDNRSGFETEPLRGTSELELWDAEGDADGVRMAVLPLDENHVAVALSWVTSCAREDDDFGRSLARARVVHLSLSGDDAPAITFDGDVVLLGETTRIPLLVATAGPFFVPGFERSDRTVSEDDRGGFLALTRDGRVQMRRLAAFDGQLVNEDESISFGSTTETYLAPGPDGQVVSYRAADSELRSVSLSCGAP